MASVCKRIVCKCHPCNWPVLHSNSWILLSGFYWAGLIHSRAERGTWTKMTLTPLSLDIFSVISAFHKFRLDWTLWWPVYVRTLKDPLLPLPNDIFYVNLTFKWFITLSYHVMVCLLYLWSLPPYVKHMYLIWRRCALIFKNCSNVHIWEQTLVPVH